MMDLSATSIIAGLALALLAHTAIAVWLLRARLADAEQRLDHVRHLVGPLLDVVRVHGETLEAQAKAQASAADRAGDFAQAVSCAFDGFALWAEHEGETLAAIAEALDDPALLARVREGRRRLSGAEDGVAAARRLH